MRPVLYTAARTSDDALSDDVVPRARPAVCICIMQGLEAVSASLGAREGRGGDTFGNDRAANYAPPRGASF